MDIDRLRDGLLEIALHPVSIVKCASTASELLLVLDGRDTTVFAIQKARRDYVRGRTTKRLKGY